MRINIIVNASRSDAIGASYEVACWLKHRGCEVFGEPGIAERIRVKSLEVDKLGVADLVISFGGDGTLIRAADYCSEHGTPVLGVYFGRFGFVTQCDPSELYSVLEAFLEKRCEYESRMMVQTDLYRKGRIIASLHSLNEVVLHREVAGRMLTFNVTVDDHELTSYPADGVLVATPTGSTAYNLSAGGPIVDPQVEVLILTAIAPHTLGARPIVLSANSTVRMSVEPHREAVLSCDGQHRLHLVPEDYLVIRRSPRYTRFVKVPGAEFLVKLSKKIITE